MNRVLVAIAGSAVLICLPAVGLTAQPPRGVAYD
jgi:hypothetical protein